jgi:AcrR family transcriptional regulator
MAKEKTSKRKIQAAKTNKNIFEAAKKLFIEHGIDNVSVDSIVEAAGVSKGTFYIHFKSKDTLASLLINDYVTEIDLDYKSYLEGLGSEVSAYDTIILMTEKIVEIIDYKIGHENMKVLYKAHLTKNIDAYSSINYNRELYKMFEFILNKGVRQGEFRLDIPVDTLAHHFVLAMRGITFEWCIRYPDFILKEQSLEHVKIMLNGITKKN